MNDAPKPPAINPQDPLLAGLNEPQRHAVVHTDGPLLVLAGAGSGKTRVITHRIAWLVQRRRVAPWHILAVTFTNKAAKEMRERLEKLLGVAGMEVQVSTFHAAGAVILRREAQRLGLSPSFVIYDDADQMQLLKRAMKDVGVDESITPRTVRNRIDHAKNHGVLPHDMHAAPGDRVGFATKKAYAQYEKLLRQANAVDFGDLLLKVVDLFRRDKEALDKYRRRFRYVLVDEFQDTNPVQYELLQLLCPQNNANLCVVGDDDQSIYRWRGADVSNILSFERSYPGAEVVKLEQNYRSDSGILEAAYAVIRRNLRRKEKKLWTDRPRGVPFGLLMGQDERGEAQEIARAIRALAADGVPHSEMAICFRINAQSRVLEEAMRLSAVPYHVVRGRAFYDRAEIKDAAAYLRLAVNPKSDTDFERVLNVPARGIGTTTLERLQDFARDHELSLFEASARAGEITTLNAGARRKLVAFNQLVTRIGEETAKAEDAHTAVSKMLEHTGLIDTYVAEGSEESGERAENLREFLGAAMEFDRIRSEEAAQQPPAPPPPAEGEEAPEPLKVPQTALEAFLEQISLIGDADAGGSTGRVALMTLHAAKGLEFDAVFLTGLEEGVFPHSRALKPEADPEEIEEERRLAYVGITRARKRLFLSLARSRALFGELKFNAPSRFLSDIPRELFAFEERQERAPAPIAPTKRAPGETYVELDEDVDLGDGDGFEPDEFDQRPQYERAAPKPPPRRLQAASAQAMVGMRVRHQTFGEGLVIGMGGGAGPMASVLVRFPGIGEKKIVARFLTPV